MAFKMKGSPMQRNFGIGASPAKLKKESPMDMAKKSPAEYDILGKLKETAKTVKNRIVDEAKAVGQFTKEAFTDKPHDRYTKGTRMTMAYDNVKKERKAERKKQRKVNRGVSTVKGLKNPEKTTVSTSKEQNMKTVKKMQKRKADIDALNKKNPNLKLKM